MTRRLEFGKYRGHRLDEVPASYLDWVLRQVEWASPSLREAILDELNRRSAPSPSLRALPMAVTPATALQIIEAGRRTLAKTYHPDVGGDTVKMVEVNASADWLENLLRSIDRAGVA